MGTRSRDEEAFTRSRETGDENDVEGHSSRSRGPEDATRSRDTEDFTRSREAGGEDDVEGHAFRGRTGASTKGE